MQESIDVNIFKLYKKTEIGYAADGARIFRSNTIAKIFTF